MEPTALAALKKWIAALVLVACIAGIFILLAARHKASQDTRPNILLVSFCSVRADHMGCYGYRRNTSPNLDALARDAVVFDRAISPWPKTVPAFASIATGKYPHTTGVMRSTPSRPLGDEHDTLAEVLRSHGYETAAFIATPVIGLQSNILQGCDTVDEAWRDSGSRWGAVTRAAAWLAQPHKEPFFAWLLFVNAHYPYQGRGTDADVFVDDEFYDSTRRVAVNPPDSLDLPVPSEHPLRRQILRPDLGGVHPQAVLNKRPNELDFYVARYDAGIYGADQMAGRVLQAARQLGLWQNTVIAAVADHGESLGEHNFYFEHGRFPYDTTAWVPLIIRPPGGCDARRVEGPVHAMALAPTLLDMVGIRPPDAMEAASLAPQMRGERPSGYVFAESGYQFDYTLSVRDERWKLIHVPNEIDRSLQQRGEFELYDMVADPGEGSNRYEAEPEVAQRLRHALEEWASPWIEVACRPFGQMKLELDEQTIEQMKNLGYLQ